VEIQKKFVHLKLDNFIEERKF